MDDLSDTESESSVSAGGWDATDFMQMATELGRICETPVDSVNLRDALDILRGLDICAVERDEQLHETIQQVSNALLSFLDSVGGTADQSNNNLEEIRANLSAILNESQLVLLLEYRTLFRTIASRSLADSTTAIATSTWLYHLEVSAADISLGHSVEWWDEDLVHALETDSSAALSMTSRLLHAVLVAEDTAVVLLDDAVLDVVLKACWSIKHILQAAEISDEALCPLYKILYKIFVGMGVGELDLAVKDLIIEGLSLSPGSFRLALAAFEDPHLEQVQEWRQKLGYMIKYATAKTLNGSSTLELRNIRQTLQLFTLVWSVGCTAGVLSESRLLLSSLLDWLESEPLDSLEWEMLGDATIGALAMSPHLAGSSEPHLGDDFLWDFFREIDPTDLPFAASLSAYVATTVASGSKGSLAYAEAWNYFLDVVLLIFNHEFVGAEEPLALLVCPSICRALMALLQHAPPTAKRYMSASPWTGCMAMNMRSLKKCQPEDTDEYNTILCELLGSSVEVMCREVRTVSTFEYRALTCV
ncbi:hypothetical protein BC628DRAFT_1323010 [Trametes gibbosa]|nr:hypothetical protein BC628DRAFT_1323010 [Trametes gibbosa]